MGARLPLARMEADVIADKLEEGIGGYVTSLQWP